MDMQFGLLRLWLWIVALAVAGVLCVQSRHPERAAAAVLVVAGIGRFISMLPTFTAWGLLYGLFLLILAAAICGDRDGRYEASALLIVVGTQFASFTRDHGAYKRG